MDCKEVLRERLTIPLRGSPRVTLVQLGGDEIVDGASRAVPGDQRWRS
jgi:hypothetical protein